MTNDPARGEEVPKEFAEYWKSIGHTYKYSTPEYEWELGDGIPWRAAQRAARERTDGVRVHLLDGKRKPHLFAACTGDCRYPNDFGHGTYYPDPSHAGEEK